MKYLKSFEVKGYVKEINKLVTAARKGSSALVKKLIKTEDINEVNDHGDTALMCAVEGKYILIVDTLIKAGADVNVQNIFGTTALMMANTNKIFIKILESVADVNIQNKNGRTAIMIYLNGRFDQIKTMLNRKEEINLDLDIKDIHGNNFYDIIKSELAIKTIPSHLKENMEVIEEYMNEHFPQYKEEWDFKNDVEKFNL